MKCLRTLFYFTLCIAIISIGIKWSLNHCQQQDRITYTDPISKQCLIPQIRLVHTTLPEITNREPIPKRDVSVLYYLQCSVRIHVGNVSGSGTICYYDPQKNEAYVISCSHLFPGTENPGASKTHNTKINVFYKNDTKLTSPQTFNANVICSWANRIM